MHGGGGGGPHSPPISPPPTGDPLNRSLDEALKNLDLDGWFKDSINAEEIEDVPLQVLFFSSLHCRFLLCSVCGFAIDAWCLKLPQSCMEAVE